MTHDAAEQANASGASFELQFSSMSCPEVGYQFRGSSNRDLSCGFGRDLCKASQENGAVQRGASKSLEVLGEGKDHMVACDDEYANAGGGAEPMLGAFASGSLDTHTLRSESQGMPYRVKDVGKSSYTSSISSSKSCVQLPCVGARDGDGCTLTQSDDESRRNADEGSAVADRMEFEGGGEVLATL